MNFRSSFFALFFVFGFNACSSGDETSPTTNGETTNNNTNNGDSTNNVDSTNNNLTNNNIGSNNRTNNDSTNNQTPRCGDGVVNQDVEQCDPAPGATAVECGLNYIGPQVCTSDCEIDRSNCTPVFTQISAGGQHTCGLRPDGSVRCWGGDQHGQLTPPAGVLFQKISAGMLHTCGIDLDRKLHCWGGHGDGLPQPPAGDFTDLGAGSGYACAISTVPSISCWGEVPPGGEYENLVNPDAISVGLYQTCVSFGDETHCWGLGESENLVRPDQISVGEYYRCLLVGSDVSCSGGGVPHNEVSAGPAIGLNFNNLDTGRYHACGILENVGTVSCWGNANHIGTPPSVELTQISVGDYHACGLDDSGQAHCWGGPRDQFDQGQKDVPTD